MSETLGTFIDHIDDYYWEDVLFLPEDRPWTSGTPILVAEMEDLPEDVALPEDLAPGFPIHLQLALVMDVIGDAAAQLPGVDIDTIIAALNYYYDNDEYMAL